MYRVTDTRLLGLLVLLHCASGEGLNWMRSWVPEPFRRLRGRGGVTYVFLEGCHKRLGCTLVRDTLRPEGCLYPVHAFGAGLHRGVVLC